MTEHRRQNIKKSLISQHRSISPYQPRYAKRARTLESKRCNWCDGAMRSVLPGDSAAMRCDVIASVTEMPNGNGCHRLATVATDRAGGIGSLDSAHTRTVLQGLRKNGSFESKKGAC